MTNPEDVYKDIATKIVASSLLYGSSLNEEDKSLATKASAEYAYLLLHLVDRVIFNNCGVEKRNAIFEKIAQCTLAEFSRAIIKPGAPFEVHAILELNMLDDLNKRQDVYGRCESLTGQSFPGAGTMIFALSYFIHYALEKTKRTDVYDIICGNKQMEKEYADAFPNIFDILRLTIYVNESFSAMQEN